jgi:serine/threonine protein kinase
MSASFRPVIHFGEGPYGRGRLDLEQFQKEILFPELSSKYSLVDLVDRAGRSKSGGQTSGLYSAERKIHEPSGEKSPLPADAALESGAHRIYGSVIKLFTPSKGTYKTIADVLEGAGSEALGLRLADNRHVVKMEAIFGFRSSTCEIEEITDLDEVEHPEDVYIVGSKTKKESDVDLQEYLQTDTFTIDEIKHIYFQVLQALKHIQDSGMLHRDVKPANIFINPDTKEIKLGDLGLLIPLSSLSRADTKAVGTTIYKPHEVFNGEKSNVKSDLYSAALVIYKMITGSELFGIKDVHAMGVVRDCFASSYKSPAKTSRLMVSGTGCLYGVLRRPEIGRISKVHCLGAGIMPGNPWFAETRVTFEDFEQKVFGKGGSPVDARKLYKLLLKSLDPDYRRRVSLEGLLKGKLFKGLSASLRDVELDFDRSAASTPMPEDLKDESLSRFDAFRIRLMRFVS